MERKIDARKLIQSYKKRIVLWNRNDPQYGKKGPTSMAWKQLAKEINAPIEQCHKKVKYLRRVFNRERCRILNAASNGEVYSSTWYAFKSLNFLADHLKPTTCKSNETKSKTNDLEPTSSKNDDLKPAVSSKRDDLKPAASSNTARTRLKDVKHQVHEEPRKSKRISSKTEKSMIQSEIVSSQDTSATDNDASFLGFESEEAEDGREIGFLAAKDVVKIETISIDSESEMEEADHVDLCHQEMTFESENIRSASRHVLVEEEVEDPNQSNINGNMPVIVNCQGHVEGFSSHGLHASSRSWISSGEDEECHSFGVYIGNKLRNYSKDMRSKVQHAFSNIIFSADQGHLDPV